MKPILIQDWSNLFQYVGESFATHRSSFLLKDLNKIQSLKFCAGHCPADKSENLANYLMLFLTYPFIPSHGLSASNRPISTIYVFFPLGSCSCYAIHLEMTSSMPMLQTQVNSTCPSQLFLMMFFSWFWVLLPHRLYLWALAHTSKLSQISF